MKDILEFATPEEVGISSNDICALIDDIRSLKIYLHSFIILRHGKVCAECYAHPFNEDRLHRMYSVSKSFTSMALGILIGEGKVKLTDKISSYFPEYEIGEDNAWAGDMTFREALTMCTPFSDCPYAPEDENYLDPTFAKKSEHPAGTVFNYDTAPSCLITAIIEKISGMPLMEFLKERALLEIGFSPDATCIEMPQGNSWGGSGVLCTTRDLARFALLIAQGGKANGKQLIPKEYIDEATSLQVDNTVSGHPDLLMENGYGYQVWRTFENGFAFWGMGGQGAFFFPDKELILITNADTQGANYDYPVLYPFLYNIIKRVSDEPLPENTDGLLSLCERIADFSLPIPRGEKSSPTADRVRGKVFERIGGREDIKSFSLSFEDDGGVLTLNTDRGEKKIPFGIMRYEEYSFPETHYSGAQLGVPLGNGYRTISAAAWAERDKLVIKTNIVDDFLGNMSTVIAFKEDVAVLSMRNCAEGFLEEYTGEVTGKMR